MRYIFFSLRNFKVDVGENVRMYGILNTLASQGKEVVFISNVEKYDAFYPSIKHVFIGDDFTDKRTMQGLLSLLPAQLVYYRYYKLFKKIKDALETAKVGNEPVYFFDYLDNSIGHILKKTGLIAGYINDVHGIATIEFLNHQKNATGVSQKKLYQLKYKLAYQLDKKVFRNAAGFIYGSYNMKKYYEDLYGLRQKKSYVIPYMLGEDAVNRKVDEQLKERLQKELNLAPKDFVVLFVGTYKPTAGVEDLIQAFDLLHQDYPDSKLILVGQGPRKDKCLKLVSQLKCERNTSFIEHIPYMQLSTYQSLAHVIVCPDTDNLFSQYVIHVKYLDALTSGKLVINGNFESVKEINKDDLLSISFEPSNVRDLYEKLKLCKEQFESLMEKYKDVKEYAAQHFTYNSYLKTLTGDEPNE